MSKRRLVVDPDPRTFGEWFAETTRDTEQLRFALHFIPGQEPLVVPGLGELRAGVPLLTYDGHFAEVRSIDVQIVEGKAEIGALVAVVPGELRPGRRIQIDRIRSAGGGRGALVELRPAT